MTDAPHDLPLTAPSLNLDHPVTSTWPAPAPESLIQPVEPRTQPDMPSAASPTAEQFAALGAIVAPEWAPGLESVGPFAIPVLDAPTVRSAFRTDMAKLAGVVLAAIFTMQLIVPFVWIMITVITNPEIIQSITSGQTDTTKLMQSLGSGMIWMNIAAAVAGALFYLILRGRRMFTTDVTTTIPVGNRWPIIGKGVVVGFGAIFMVVMLNALVYALTNHYLSGAESKLVGSLNTSIVGVLYIVLIGPVIEELVFRGAVLRHLMPYGVNFAIVTQALLFGLYHMNFFQSLHAFLLGLVLGYLAARFSLKWAIALHILNNGLSMITATSPIAGDVYMGILAACLIGAIAIVVLDRQKGKPLITEGRSTVVAQPFRIGWTQPFFLVVVIVLFIFGLLINYSMM